MIRLMCLYICVVTLRAQIIFPGTKPKTCVTKQNDRGVCKEFIHCPEARDEYLKGGLPTFCRLNRFRSGVCCVSKGSSTEKPTAAPISDYLEKFADTCGFTSQVPGGPILSPPLLEAAVPKPAISKPAILKPVISKPAILKPALLKPDVLKPFRVARSAQLDSIRQPSVPLPLTLEAFDALTKVDTFRLPVFDKFKEPDHQIQVVGGEDALRNAWPWMALLGTADRSWFCGGALISDRHIITAAHCFNSIPVPSIVRLGEHDVSTTSESNHIDLRDSTVIRHPRYNALRGLHDIAIVILKRPVSFSQYIRPICLPNGSVTPESDKIVGTITGWGTTSFGGVSSNILQQVKVPIVNKILCENSYKSLGPSFFNTFPNGFPKELFCAAEEGGGKDACQGDSGGPFMVKSGGRYTLEGVVSAGRGCGSADFPGLYMAVYPYLSWIKSKATA